MATATVTSSASEEQVRTTIVQALAPHGAIPAVNEPGSLVLETGSVGKAFLAGPFRDKMKMPMRIAVTATGSAAGTSVAIEVGSRSTGGGYMSGGLIGVAKQRKAERIWLDLVMEAVPGASPGPTV
jgi:hypothetical protein